MNGTVKKAEIARAYGVSLRTVTNWMYKEKRISFLKIGRIVRFDPITVAKELREAGLVKIG